MKDLCLHMRTLFLRYEFINRHMGLFSSTFYKKPFSSLLHKRYLFLITEKDFFLHHLKSSSLLYCLKKDFSLLLRSTSLLHCFKRSFLFIDRESLFFILTYRIFFSSSIEGILPLHFLRKFLFFTT